MSKIIELPKALANQIAAGEVVERPASVVKELVENAIDAGATRIQVRVEEAGLRLIEVVDNGSGIEAEDVPRALLRHATSKLKSQEDLFRIRTLGFRGEALPSIASVSLLTIDTSAASEDAGTHLQAKGGVVESNSPLAKVEGTKIRVENLFYNTPARLKYIKSLQAELSHSIDILNRLSLAHPEIAFTLVNDGHPLLTTTGSGDLRQAVAQVYGLATARKLRLITAENLDFKLTGYVSLPELTRANRSYITLLLNGRYIKNFALNRAIIEGYGSKLMVGRFPLAVLSIQIDPQLADVNVHPSKQEVRLSKEGELMALIRGAIRETLGVETLIPSAMENLGNRSGGLNKAVEPQGTETDRPVGVSYQSSQAPIELHEPLATYEAPPRRGSAAERRPATGSQTALEFDGTSENVDLAAQAGAANRPAAATNATKNQTFPDLTYLAQLHLTYLLCESSDGLYIVDQHAAQERVKYEYWRDKIGEVSFDQQTLLVPVFIDLPKDDFLAVAEKKEQLEEAGIFLEEYGESQFILREHPVWMREGEIESATYALIDLLLGEREVSVKKYREDLAIMMSCKASIKANMRIDPDGARDLLKQLATCENPYNCPHGRPAVVKFTSTEVEKMFRRIQASHKSARLNALEA